MTTTLDSLLYPPTKADIEGVIQWMNKLADELLHRTTLVAGTERFRFAEIEAYIRCPVHPDPFVHAYRLQRQSSRWYFHRTGNVYRGGSFKGLDITCGPETSDPKTGTKGDWYGGMLIRSLIKSNGEMLEGPCNCVNHLLSITGSVKVADLDKTIAGRLVTDATNVMKLEVDPEAKVGETFRSARVGLSLKRAKGGDGMPEFIGQPYRYMVDPVKQKKGRVPIIAAMHALGWDAAEKKRRSGATASLIKQVSEMYDRGATETDASAFFGKDLSTSTLARLLGLCSKLSLTE